MSFFGKNNNNDKDPVKQDAAATTLIITAYSAMGVAAATAAGVVAIRGGMIRSVPMLAQSMVHAAVADIAFTEAARLSASRKGPTPK